MLINNLIGVHVQPEQTTQGLFTTQEEEQLLLLLLHLPDNFTTVRILCHLCLWFSGFTINQCLDQIG